MASGYLIVKQFDVLYDAAVRSGTYNDNPATAEPIYGIPHKSRPLVAQGLPRYRGIDREPLRALTSEHAKLFTEVGTPCTATPATNLFDEIETTTGREDGWITTVGDMRRVWDALGSDQRKYEVIFGKEYQDPTHPPEGAEFLGSDAAYFVCDHFSCICDALFFPRWHGTDPEGLLFKEHFDQLNRNGLFESNERALDYLRYYLSFDWTERDEKFTAIEAYAVQTGQS
ncbi:MAG: hypothetical protein RDV41_10295 [Planctomycetota bacterium]|nr:hypothetical protein [Planctomycetota bacterium]